VYDSLAQVQRLEYDTFRTASNVIVGELGEKVNSKKLAMFLILGLSSGTIFIASSERPESAFCHV